jgi:hypothetical protein
MPLHLPSQLPMPMFGQTLAITLKISGLTLGGTMCDFGSDATVFTHLGYGYWTCPECEKMHEA